MRHAHVRRASAAALLGLATAAAHAQPSWPLDPATLPAAITGIPPGVGWPSPPLGDGPFLVESVRPEHRTLRVVVVARGLEQPWSIAFLPDGDMLVTERPGRLRLIRDGVLDPNPVAGVPAVRARGLAGLHGRRAAPALRGQPLRVSLVSPARPERTPAKRCWPAAAGRTVRSSTCATSSRPARSGPRARASASRADGMLHMTISAPGVGPDVVRSQDPKDYAGKTIRLRDDGSIPRDNPFVNDARYMPAIYTLGHRNGHSMALNPWTGELWVDGAGPERRRRDQRAEAGRQLRLAARQLRARLQRADRVAEPDARGHGAAARLLGAVDRRDRHDVLSGRRVHGWRRSAFVGGLREGEVPRTGQLQRIEFNERWEEIRREPLLRELKQRIRDVREGPDGLLYVLTAEAEGAVLRIEPATTGNRSERSGSIHGRTLFLAASGMESDAVAGSSMIGRCVRVALRNRAVLPRCGRLCGGEVAANGGTALQPRSRRRRWRLRP